MKIFKQLVGIEGTQHAVTFSSFYFMQTAQLRPWRIPSWIDLVMLPTHVDDDIGRPASFGTLRCTTYYIDEIPFLRAIGEQF